LDPSLCFEFKINFQTTQGWQISSLFWSFGAMANTTSSDIVMVIYAQVPCSMPITFLELYWDLMLEVWHALPHTQNPFPFEHVTYYELLNNTSF
jgi:hypothetical protein